MGAVHTYNAHGGSVCSYFTFGKKFKIQIHVSINHVNYIYLFLIKKLLIGFLFFVGILHS